MGLFFVYILKSSVCLAGFYLFYRLLLSKETFHRFNRIALLGVLLFSCLIPLVEVSVKSPMEIQRSFLSLEEMMLMPKTESVEAVAEALPVVFPWWALLFVVYLVGVLFFLMRHFWSLGRMLRLVKRCRKSDLEDGIMLLSHEEKKVAPFSWMKYVVVCEEDLKENGDAILAHECAHVKNGHSWDLLLAEICIFFQWFNPAAWLLKQELQNIHEYEADEWVINQGIDAKRYQLLLIKKAVGARLYSIANSFNHSSLKKRITMMIKKKSNPWARMKYLYVLPLAAITVAAFARPEVSNKLDEISSVKVNDLTSIMKTDEVKNQETVVFNEAKEKRKITGVVYDRRTMAVIAGASVVVKGTANGTFTRENGKFELEMEVPGILQISFAGYDKADVALPEDIDREVNVGLYEDKGDSQELTVKFTPVEVEETVGEESEIFQVVEQMPQFPGGMVECMKFLAQNIKCPIEVAKSGVQGKVVVQFVVKKDGTIADSKVIRSVHPEFDAEVLRVVNLMPKWQPGMQKGKPVDVKYTIPVNLNLPIPDSKEEVFQDVSLKVDKDVELANVEKVKNHLRPLASKADVEKDNSSLVYVVVVDGVEIGMGAEALQKVRGETIKNINMLSAKNAVAKYGEKGKDGAVEIITKKN